MRVVIQLLLFTFVCLNEAPFWSHLLELLLIRLQDVVGHVAHLPPGVSHLPPLPRHVQQLQGETVQPLCCSVDTSLCLLHTRLNDLPFPDGEFLAVSGGEVVHDAHVLRCHWAGGTREGIRSIQRLGMCFGLC